MITLTKEWLLKTIAELEEERDATPGAVNEDAANALAAMKLALASLEAEPVAWRSLYYENHGLLTGSKNVLASWQKQGWECEPLYTAPPAPVSVPYLLEQFAEFMAAESIKSGDYPDGWQCKASNAAHEYAQNIRAAMLQGADRPQNEPQNIPEIIPATQFKPVADLYGLTSSTGSETSFTFDAVEARDFIDGGWSCQEYVELERYQNAVAGNSPVIPDGYCIMPLKLTANNGAKGALCGEFHVHYRIVCQSCVGEGCDDCNHTGGWDAEIPVSWDTIKRIHEAAVEACALPAAPQQEVK
ncbi:hypothetical protein M8S01_12750 [Enterobacter hormaechei]|nr:hypothetical protein [Enterobacter hormaechei]